MSNDAARQISYGGGVQPLWGKASSRELFYWTLKGTLKIVSLTLTPDLNVGGQRAMYPSGTATSLPLPGGVELSGLAA